MNGAPQIDEIWLQAVTGFVDSEGELGPGPCSRGKNRDSQRQARGEWKMFCVGDKGWREVENGGEALLRTWRPRDVLRVKVARRENGLPYWDIALQYFPEPVAILLFPRKEIRYSSA